MKKESVAFHKVMRRAIDDIQNRYDVCLSEVSEGSIPGFALIGLGFDHCGALSKDDARTIIVNSAEMLIDEMNSSEELRPYLKDRYPCAIREVSIVLFVRDNQNEKLYHPNIAVAFTRGNTIYYRTEVPEDPYGYFERTEEPYEEALAIVKAQKGQQL